MDTLCHAALVCCILSALAGLVRTFWPQNGFKPVINAVLTLYIITSVLHAVSGLNWQNFDAQLQNFASQSAPGEDYTAYGAELAMQESAAALQKLLRQSGIESVVQPQARGVAVLCQGGGNAGTPRRITELVSALTGVGASHITVNKMQS